MHISEGVLSAPVLAAGWALAIGGIAIGLKKTPIEKLPQTALVSGVLFLASLVHIPVGPSSVHLTLLGLAGILLGFSSIPSLCIALFLQGLLFQFGGLLSLGINTVSMGTAALTGGFIFNIFPAKIKFIGAFAASFTAVLVATALVVSALYFSDNDLKTTAALLFAANVPLAVVEGFISVFIIGFISKIKPGLLKGVSAKNAS
ncbi:MAG: cobalt transporter CbiM [Termitinemataceae bacterium]|nr:MAG: cobalt transporter CbiM [Termitinemataceae bacterium]